MVFLCFVELGGGDDFRGDRAFEGSCFFEFLHRFLSEGFLLRGVVEDG